MSELPRSILPPAGAVMAVALAAAGTAACGEETTDVTGGGTGGAVASAVVTDPPPAGAEEPFTATLRGEYRVEISRDGESFTSLGSFTTREVLLQTEGNDQVIQTGAPIEEGTYSRVRLGIREGLLAIQAGSVVGGRALDAPVSIAFGRGGVPMDVTLSPNPFTAEPGSAVTLTIDLNSTAWITTETIERGSLTGEEIAAAAEVDVAVE